MIKRSAPYCIIVGFYYLNIAEEYISLLKETKKNKCVTSFFFSLEQICLGFRSFNRKNKFER